MKKLGLNLLKSVLFSLVFLASDNVLAQENLTFVSKNMNNEITFSYSQDTSCEVFLEKELTLEVPFSSKSNDLVIEEQELNQSDRINSLKIKISNSLSGTKFYLVRIKSYLC